MEPKIPNQRVRVIEQVKQIPAGKVTTYGTVGKLTGVNPRVVGWIMAGLNEEEMQVVPWQRVIAAGGFISTYKMGDRGVIQQQLLEAEGVLCSKEHVDPFEDYLLQFITL